MSRRIWWLPIESLEERYSAQWYKWFKREFDSLELDHVPVYGEVLSDKIREGSFLDVIGTNYFKAKQLQHLCALFDLNKIMEDDIILLHDGWFPGIEMLAYIRDALDLKFKIYGIFHAGTYDPFDFLTQRGMRKWGIDLEKSWFKIYDGIFVATEFHKRLILSFYDIGRYFHAKIHVTGLPIYPEFVQPDILKENIVVFPHRLDPEKQPEYFDDLRVSLQPIFPDWKFIKTKDVCTNKLEYYNLLNRAKISVSCALQETWGIAMQESVMCGCVPIVPNRLSYRELYPAFFQYDSFEDLKEKVKYCIKTSGEIIESLRLEILRKTLIKKGAEAIPNMVKIMMGE